MIQTFIQETEYKFDLGNIYKHLLLNKESIEFKLISEAFHSLMRLQKGKIEPTFPFYPKNWSFVKEKFEEYLKNNLQDIPNEYYFVRTSFEESNLSQEEKNLILATTAIKSGNGIVTYNRDKWKDHQYHIFALEKEFVIDWEDTETHKYWLSWYLALLDESLFNKNLLSFLCSFTKIDKEDLSSLLEDLRIKNLSIFQLSDWDRKLRFLSTIDLEPNLINTENSESEMNTAGRPQNEVVIGKLITRKEHGEVTDLSLDESLALFSLLNKYKCIVLDKRIVPKSTTGKVIAAITGYSPDTISRKIENYEIKEETYRKIREKIGPLMSFINSELQK